MLTQRTWRTQFRDYPVPPEIEELVASGMIQDTSWGNDICPSFEMHRHGQGIRIWVDHPDPERREMKNPQRFFISPLVWDASGGAWVIPESSTPLLTTDSIADVLSFVERFDRKAIPEVAE
jgi:hypothetical protein